MGSPSGVRGICGRGRVEFALEVPVAEPVDGEVAGQHRGEQVGRVRVDRVEGGNAGCRDGLAQGVEFGGGRNVSMIMRQALVQFRLGGSGLF